MALASAPEGLLRPGPPASDADIAADSARLTRALPRSYVAFLRSFDGADLFHETIVLGGVGAHAYRRLSELARSAINAGGLVAGDLVFADSVTGDRFLFPQGDTDDRVIRVRAGSDERWLAGSTFPRWLDASLARELLLYGPDGEFVLEAFEADGEELTPAFAIRQAERALRKDPGSAESHHDLGVAYRRLGRLDRAREAFSNAAALDPANPLPWFDLGRADLITGRLREAVTSFRRAADALPSVDGARMFAWAARAAFEAGDPRQTDEARHLAETRNPAIRADLQRSLEAARDEEDPEAATEAEALLIALDPGTEVKHRLPLASPGPSLSPRKRRPR